MEQETNKTDILARICEKELGASVASEQNTSTGYAGHVFVVATSNKQVFIIKLMEGVNDAPFEVEQNDNRVYGVRWSNLMPTHALLSQHNIPVPKIYAIGKDEVSGFDYCVMEKLEGESIREFLAHQSHPDILKLHALVGATMGKLHQITRGFQGWVDMEHAYVTSWKEAFFQSFDNHLDIAAEKDAFVRENMARIKDFVTQKQSAWTDPKAFVLAHTDGFQGMALYENNEWALTGIIDIEDHEFTDPRFVLAGHELSLKYEGRENPKEFWDAYKQHSEVDPHYAEFKDLFQLYYLLSWLPYVVYENWRGKPEDKEGAIKHFAELIDKIVSTKS